MFEIWRLLEEDIGDVAFLKHVVDNYTVSTKKLHPCIHCHNSHKQRQILTQFYANTETLNCKQVTKLQQNRSTAAIATASLVGSLKNISVHYRHRRDWLSSVRSCKIANGKTSAHLKSVFKMSTVCSNASSKTWSPLPDHFIDDQLVEMFLLFDRSAGRRHESGCGTYTLLQLLPNLLVDGVKIRTVSWPQSWSDEVWCFMS